MAYTINLTDGTVFATIADGTVNTSSSMTLVGKNYAGYGEFLDENFIHLLENGSNTSAPSSPLVGQLWWDKTNNLLKVYNGTIFKTISAATASASTPSSNVTGDLWYDTTNQQLKVYTGSTWIVVGPAYSASEGTTGAIPGSIVDNGGITSHPVIELQIAGATYAIVSKDSSFIPQTSSIANAFPRIYPGITANVQSGSNFAGNLVNVGNLTLTAGGATTVVVTNTGANVAGYVTATANVTGGNLLTAGIVSGTGNITGGNVRTVGVVSATGNVTGGNIISGAAISAAGLVSATGNITGGNLITLGAVSATGNLVGGNVISVAAVSAASVNSTGNVQGGNLRTTGLVSATGNITSAGNIDANYFLGNGALLTGISAAVSVTKIVNGTSNVEINASGGNVAFTVGGTANVTVVSSTGVVSNGITVPSITKSGSNAVGNIGSSSNYFNQVFATATTALYADVAERFAADEYMEPGTVVELGGSAEITKSQHELSDTVFGVISTRPAFTMNGGAGENETHPPVAMTGRVPVKVIGLVNKGDRLVSAGNGLARSAKIGEATPFNVLGRSLVAKTTDDIGFVEAIVSIR